MALAGSSPVLDQHSPTFMSRFSDRVILHVNFHHRVLSTGEIVVGQNALEQIPSLIPCGKKLGCTQLEYISIFERRPREFSIACIPGLCQRLGEQLDSQSCAYFLNPDNLVERPERRDQPKRPRHELAPVPLQMLQQKEMQIVDIDRPQAADALKYKECSKEQLVAALLQMKQNTKRTTLRLTENKRKVQVQLLRARQHILVLSNKVDEYKNQRDEQQLAITSANHGPRLGLQGIVALGTRRSLANAAQDSMAIALLDDRLNRWKVSRAEKTTADLYLQAAAQFHHTMEHELKQLVLEFGRSEKALTPLEEEMPFNIHGINFSSDATGRGCMRGDKANTCIVNSVFYIDARYSAEHPLEDLPCVKRACDVLKCEGGTAGHLYTLIQKHFRSINCPLWDLPTLLGNWRLYLYCTDRGSDCVCLRDALPLLAAKGNLVATSDCWDHATQCVEHDGLKLLDASLEQLGKPKWYSSFTKGCHLWRRYHVPVFNIVKLHGPDVAKPAQNLVQPCDAGRWGSKNIVTKKVIAVGMGNLFQAFKEVLKLAAAAKPIADAPSRAAVDEIAIDKMQQFTEVRSRWSRETLQSWALPHIRFATHIDQRHCAPAENMRNFMRTKLSEELILEKGRHLAQLVTGDVDRIAHKYDDLIFDGTDVELMIMEAWESCEEPLSREDAVEAHGMAARHIYCQAASFRWRMLDDSKRFPLVFMRFAEQPRDAKCKVRQSLSSVILKVSNREPGRLHPLIRGLLEDPHFAAEFRRCETDGTLGPRLFAVSKVMRRQMTCSVAPNETLNSVIKKICDKCRNIHEHLVSSRCVLTHGLERVEAKNNYKHLVLMGEALLNTCLDAVTDAKANAFALADRPDASKQYAARSLLKRLVGKQKPNQDDNGQGGQHALGDAPRPELAEADLAESHLRWEAPPPAKNLPNANLEDEYIRQEFDVPLNDIAFGKDYELVWRGQVKVIFGFACGLAVQLYRPRKSKTQPEQSVSWHICMQQHRCRYYVGEAAAIDDAAGVAEAVHLIKPLNTFHLSKLFARHHDDLINSKIAVRTFRLMWDFDGNQCLSHASLASRSRDCQLLIDRRTKAEVEKKKKQRAKTKQQQAIQHEEEQHEPEAAIADEAIEDQLGQVLSEYGYDQADGDAGGDDVGLRVSKDLFADARLQHVSRNIAAAAANDSDPEDVVAEGTPEAAEDRKFVQACEAEDQALAEAIAVGMCPGELLQIQESLDEACEHEHDTPPTMQEALCNLQDALGVKHIPCLRPARQMDGYAQLWANQTRDGVVAILERLAVMSPGPAKRLIGQDNDLVMLETRQGRIEFAHNMSEDNMHGTIADIDWAKNSVKTIVYVGAKRVPMDFSNSTIIHPAVGTAMKKTRGRHRPILRPDIVTLKEMWSIVRGTSLDYQCELCGQGECDGDIVNCWLCRVPAHAQCREQLAMMDDVIQLAVAQGLAETELQPSSIQMPFLQSAP